MAKQFKMVMIGRPNDGKSSIFANFLGDDKIAVSPIPGETKKLEEKKINLEDFDFDIVDTPGLQHPETVYKAFLGYKNEGLNPPEEFLKDYTDSKYLHDLQIMKALLGANIVLFVANADNIFNNTSKLLLDSLCMIRGEVLVLAIINKSQASCASDWLEQFALRKIEVFNFDAFKSSFADCVLFLDSLKNSKTMHGNSDLILALDSLKENRSKLWGSYLELASLEILNSLKQLLAMQTTEIQSTFKLSQEQEISLIATHKAKIIEFEEAFRRKILELFNYSGLKIHIEPRRIANDEVEVKQAGFFRKLLGFLPFFSKPKLSAYVNYDSTLTMKFLRNAMFFINTVVAISYAKSATKEYSISLDKSEYKSINIDKKAIYAFSYRATKGDDSDSFYKMQNVIKEQIIKHLRKK